MDIKSKIVQAIREKNILQLNYKDEGLRIACPHVLYISSKGNTILDAYQTSGYSTHSEQIPGWRPFDITKITDVEVLAQTFERAPDYNPTSGRYANSIAKL